MSGPFIIAAGIVIIASVAFIVIGTVYRWDLASPAYGRWTRLVGVVAVIGLGGVAAWTRRSDLPLALGVVAGSIALAAAYVAVHRTMTERVRELLGRTDARDSGKR